MAQEPECKMVLGGTRVAFDLYGQLAIEGACPGCPYPAACCDGHFPGSRPVLEWFYFEDPAEAVATDEQEG